MTRGGGAQKATAGSCISADQSQHPRLWGERSFRSDILMVRPPNLASRSGSDSDDDGALDARCFRTNSVSIRQRSRETKFAGERARGNFNDVFAATPSNGEFAMPRKKTGMQSKRAIAGINSLPCTLAERQANLTGSAWQQLQHQQQRGARS